MFIYLSYQQIIAFGLFLIDSPQNNMYKTDQKKKRTVNLAKVNTVFKVSIVQCKRIAINKTM